MGAILKQREILDRRALGEKLAELAARPETASGERRPVVAELKAALTQGYDEIRRRFEAGAAGDQTVREHCFLMDQLIRALHDFTVTHVYPLANPTAGEHLAIVAVGGYGRGELAPHSDIDLLFLLPYKLTPHAEQVIEYMLYTLWDLGLKVGNATRSVDDCLRQARADMTIRTAMLEARYVWGDMPVFDELKRRFEAEIVKDSAGEFIGAKLAERDARHQKLGDSRYHVEPNVKEGKGGLRDLQSLFWIAKYVYRADDVGKLVELGVLSEEESARFARAQNFLWTVRCHLHYLAGRAEDRLTFDVQTEIGRRMGYTDHAGTSAARRSRASPSIRAASPSPVTAPFRTIRSISSGCSARRSSTISTSTRRRCASSPRTSGWSTPRCAPTPRRTGSSSRS
jgi:[protein-PII] uridylyltransferase